MSYELEVSYDAVSYEDVTYEGAAGLFIPPLGVVPTAAPRPLCPPYELAPPLGEPLGAPLPLVACCT